MDCISLLGKILGQLYLLNACLSLCSSENQPRTLWPWGTALPLRYTSSLNTFGMTAVWKQATVSFGDIAFEIWAHSSETRSQGLREDAKLLRKWVMSTVGRQGRKQQNATLHLNEQIKQSLNALNWLFVVAYLDYISLSDQKDQRNAFRLFSYHWCFKNSENTFVKLPRIQ